MSGLLFAGEEVLVPGVTVIGQHDAAWAHMSAGDGRPRTNPPSIVILHKTKADDPERVLPSPGPTGRAERVAEFWQDDPAHSGAQIVVSDDMIACLADLMLFEAYHGNQANHRSIGIELYEEIGGIVRRGTLENGVKACLVIAEKRGIQWQVPRPGSYVEGRPMRRFEDGGSSLIGFFGHRDVTSTRGRWDPGDTIFAMLIAAGAEPYDFDAGEDLVVWRKRQQELIALGHNLIVDGVPGPKTTAALRAEGYRGGVYALGKIAA